MGINCIDRATTNYFQLWQQDNTPICVLLPLLVADFIEKYETSAEKNANVRSVVGVVGFSAGCVVGVDGVGFINVVGV